jgi:hypothetical protein
MDDKSTDTLEFSDLNRTVQRTLAWLGLALGAVGVTVADRGSAGFWLGIGLCLFAVGANAWLLLRRA